MNPTVRDVKMQKKKKVLKSKKQVVYPFPKSKI